MKKEKLVLNGLARTVRKRYLQTRAKVTKAVIESLSEAGALKNMPESSQMTLF